MVPLLAGADGVGESDLVEARVDVVRAHGLAGHELVNRLEKQVNASKCIRQYSDAQGRCDRACHDTDSKPKRKLLHGDASGLSLCFRWRASSSPTRGREPHPWTCLRHRTPDRCRQKTGQCR